MGKIFRRTGGEKNCIIRSPLPNPSPSQETAEELSPTLNLIIDDAICKRRTLLSLSCPPTFSAVSCVQGRGGFWARLQADPEYSMNQLRTLRWGKSRRIGS